MRLVQNVRRAVATAALLAVFVTGCAPNLSAQSPDQTRPGLIRVPNGDWKPAPGYVWADPNDPKSLEVKVHPGLVRLENGRWKLASGYAWVYPDDPNSLAVRLSGDQPPMEQVSESMRRIQRLANEGDAAAQYSLGRAYEIGSGVSKNEPRAYIWYRKAADQGDRDAQFAIGEMYVRGWVGVPPNPWEAGRYYKRAADLGLAAAQNNLGVMHHSGNGRPRDLDLAIDLFQQAADQGNQTASENLKLALRAKRKAKESDDAAAAAIALGLIVAGAAVASSAAENAKNEDQKACMTKCRESRERCIELCTVR